MYLCKSGFGHTEPWRYGIQVYSSPFSIDEDTTGSGNGAGGGRDLVVATSPVDASHTVGGDARNIAEPTPSRSASIVTGHPIRRVRHAEIVLVDDVCIAYDRYWLRLRWPGHKGGFAGYIAMGKVADVNECKLQQDFVSSQLYSYSSNILCSVLKI